MPAPSNASNPVLGRLSADDVVAGVAVPAEVVTEELAVAELGELLVLDGAADVVELGLPDDGVDAALEPEPEPEPELELELELGLGLGAELELPDEPDVDPEVELELDPELEPDEFEPFDPASGSVYC